MCSMLHTVCNIVAQFFPIWITCYPPMRSINFGKYLRLFQIEPIKMMEFRFNQIGKIGAKMLHNVYQRFLTCKSHRIHGLVKIDDFWPLNKPSMGQATTHCKNKA